MRRPLLAALSIFAGGVAYAVLPRGTFGAHDIAGRAAATGTVAAVIGLLIVVLNRRREPPRD